MQDVKVTFISGPQKGQVQEFEVGDVVIGRLPGARGLELQSADADVSRQHARLAEKEGGVELYNLSPNGTLVGGKIILDSVALEPGTEVAIGANHSFVLDWAVFATGSVNEANQAAKTKSPGALASPVIRAVLVVYLLGMVAMVFWLSSSDEQALSADEWPQLVAAYEGYESPGLTEELRAERLARVEELMYEAQALQIRGLDKHLGPICREIMGVDNNVRSPLFQYGAKCLAKAK
jgi:hypothetical protein